MLCGALLLAAVKAVRLTEFVILNVEALRKIVKKMDKPCPEPWESLRIPENPWESLHWIWNITEWEGSLVASKKKDSFKGTNRGFKRSFQDLPDVGDPRQCGTSYQKAGRDAMSPLCFDPRHLRGRRFHQKTQATQVTLWLCQNSYWKWPFIVDLPIKNSYFP